MFENKEGTKNGVSGENPERVGSGPGNAEARAAVAELQKRLDPGLVNEFFFSFVFKHVTDIVFLLRVEPDGGFTFVSVNPAFARATGLPSSAVIGKGVDTIIPEPSLSLVLERYRRAIDGGATVRWDETSVYPAGTKRGEVSVTPVYDSHGTCVNLVGTVRDVTDQWEVQTLRERLSSILEATIDFVAFADPETGRLQYVNHSGRELVGIGEDEDISELTLSDVHGGPDGADRPVRWREAVEASGGWRGESCLHRRDGEEIPVHTVLLGHRSPAGDLEFISVISRDITEQRAAEQMLRASRDRLEKAQEISHSGFLDWNLVTDELVCSSEVYRWYGVTREEAPTTPEFLAQVVHPDDMEMTRASLEKAVRGEAEYDLEHRIVQPGGRVRWVHAQAELIRADDGTPLRLLGTMVDITDLKLAEHKYKRLSEELEKRVEARTRELEAANRELTAFSYSVSHDLRAPLRHINGYIDLLRREAGDSLSAKAQRYLEVISASGTEMGALIDDLLSYSRMGTAQMETRPCRPRSTIDAVRAELRPLVGERRIDWEIADIPPVIADAAMLKLVFTNLLENAIKFTRPRDVARIEIGCEGSKDGRLVLFVRDNGVGFDPRYSDNMFGVFQRLHRQDEFEGTGIGLANVQRIISRHGGEVWARGELDRGATLYFTLAPAEPGAKPGEDT